jgi:ribosomal protein S18 acetylase RimI-like enzyme
MNPGTTQLRKLDAGDRLQFIQMRLKALETDPLAFGTEIDEETSYAGRRFDIILKHADDFALGCFYGGRLTGKICFNRERRRRTRHKGHIWGMYVLPEYRRSGQASSLLETALGFLRQTHDLRRIELVVVEGNEIAQRLYKKHGFVLDHVEKEAYHLGKNRFLDLMHLTLRF